MMGCDATGTKQFGCAQFAYAVNGMLVSFSWAREFIDDNG